MKIRNSFISNSSSTSFLIRNKSSLPLTLVDFVRENPQLIEEFNERYDYKYTQEELIISADENPVDFPPNSEGIYTFGDEDGTLVGHVFDYILRDGGSSGNFSWKFEGWQR